MPLSSRWCVLPFGRWGQRGCPALGGSSLSRWSVPPEGSLHHYSSLECLCHHHHAGSGRVTISLRRTNGATNPLSHARGVAAAKISFAASHASPLPRAHSLWQFHGAAMAQD